jgi:hypothetical protein
LNQPVVEESVHCVVTSCENTVAWRRVLHLRMAETGDHRSEGDPARLIADVSVYLCDEHHAAQGDLSAAERFPPDRDREAADHAEADSRRQL